MNAARRLVKRAFRDRDGRFLAEGPQACREAAAPARACCSSSTSPPRPPSGTPTSSATARAAGAEVVRASGEVVGSLSGTVTPQGMVGVCARVGADASTTCSPRAPTLVTVLAHARDPGNVGTVIRCSDAAGVGGVVLTEASVDPLNPKAVRASRRLAVPPPRRDRPARRGPRARAAGGRPARARRRRRRRARPRRPPRRRLAGRARPPGSSATRRGGCPRPTRALCDDVVRVPIHGRAETSTSPPPPRSASTPPPAPSAAAEPVAAAGGRLRCRGSPSPGLTPQAQAYLSIDVTKPLRRNAFERTVSVEHWGHVHASRPCPAAAVRQEGLPMARHLHAPDPRGDGLRRPRQLPAADRPRRVEEPRVRRLEVLAATRASRRSPRPTARSSATASGTRTRPRPTRTASGSTRRPRSRPR